MTDMEGERESFTVFVKINRFPHFSSPFLKSRC